MVDQASALQNRIDAVRQYFIRLDARRADVLDLFTEDFQFYFPKYGLGRGKDELQACSAALGSTLRALQHDMDSLRFIEDANRVAVEGLTYGETSSGAKWHGGKTAGGRFCSVFE